MQNYISKSIWINKYNKDNAKVRYKERLKSQDKEALVEFQE